MENVVSLTSVRSDYFEALTSFETWLGILKRDSFMLRLVLEDLAEKEEIVDERMGALLQCSDLLGQDCTEFYGVFNLFSSFCFSDNGFALEQAKVEEE